MHKTDAPDFLDMGGGDRRFKETPPPASVLGHHMANALQYEVAQLIEGAGLTLRASGTADEVAAWGQLKDAVQAMIDANEIQTVLDSGNIVVKDDGANTLTVNEIYGRIGYHKIENIIRLTLKFMVDVDTDTNFLEFEVPGDYRAYGAPFDIHPLVRVACCEITSGSVISEIDNIYTNMQSTSPPLANTFYLGNYQLVAGLPTSTVFPAVSGTGGYIFGINYIYRRAG